MGADTPEIAVGTVEGGLYVGLLGRATQRTCPTADQLVNDYLSTRPQEPLIVLDLDGCEWVDSTFAGWLVGLSKRMERTVGGRVCLTGCGSRCRQSLERMQLAALFRFETVAAPTETRVVACTTGDQPTKAELTLMLEAHEALAAVSAKNAEVFAPIAEALRGQIENSA
ncbi:MAG: STAS domain-containing protein [Phycisphaerae bacterium]